MGLVWNGDMLGFTWFDPTDPRLGSSLREIEPICSDWGDSGLIVTLGSAEVPAAAGARAGDGTTAMAADGAVAIGTWVGVVSACRCRGDQGSS